MRDPVHVLRRLRLPLVILLALWFFSPPSIRGAVPLWVPFVIALTLEAQFFVGNFRSTEPLFRRDDRHPGPADRERFGDGEVAEWAIVEDEERGRIWVDLSAPEEADDRDHDPGDAPPVVAGPPEVLTATPGRRRRLWRPLLEASAVLAVVAGLILLFHRGSWEELSEADRARAEARISAEASRVAGKPVTVGCDTSGRVVGGVQDADGVALVGGDRALLTPGLCYAIERLAFHDDVPSFGGTARALAVLAHEAWHLRGVRDEGLAECYAVQSGVELGRRLGLDEGEARRMMRSQLVANQLHRQDDPQYLVPEGCVNRGPHDLAPDVDRFP